MVKLKKLTTNFLAILVIISMVGVFGFMILSVFYYFNGSLEMYPSEEQMEKARFAATCILGILIILEVILSLILKAIILHTKRKDNA